MKTKLLILAISFSSIPFCSYSQDIELGNHNIDLANIKGQVGDRFKGSFFKLNGGIGLNAIYTYGNSNTSNLQPFSYIANGNVQLSFYSLRIPVSFTYSNKGFSYTYAKPAIKFNRLSLHPKYKNLTAHIGDFSLSFSPYSLSGFQMTGGGVEYTPNRFKVQAVYGRLLKAVSEDTVNHIKPSYRRQGWGVKMVYQNKNNKTGLSVFHAQDDRNSIPVPLNVSNQDVKPKEGTVVVVEGSYPVLKGLAVEAELATSVLTQNLLYESKDSSEHGENILKKLVRNANPSTAVYHALTAGLNYAINQATVGIRYERVDPEYNALGAHFYANDFENMTLQISQSFLKGKLTASVNGGLQRDDLKQKKQSAMQRTVFAGNINAKAGKKTDIGLTYSNFQTFTNMKMGYEQILQVSPYENLDTLNYQQLSQNAGLTVNHQLIQQKNQSQSIAVNLNYMETANKKGDIIYKGEVTRLVNGNLVYTINLAPQDMSISTMFMYSYNYAASQANYVMAPALNIAKSFFKKILRTNYGITYNNVRGQNLTGVLNARAGANATLKKKHNIGFTFLYQWQRIPDKPDGKLVTATLGYNFNF